MRDGRSVSRPLRAARARSYRASQYARGGWVRCVSLPQTQSPARLALRRRRARPHRMARKRTSSFASFLLDQRIELLWRHAPVELIVDHQRGRARTVAEAVDRFEREGAVRGRLMKI